MIKFLRKTTAIVFLFLSLTSYSQQPSTEAMLTKKGHIIQSVINEKAYQLYVSLPSGYDPVDAARYPVLYVLDGNMNFPLIVPIHDLLDSSGEIEKVIIIAIGDRDQSAQTWLISRALDYTPSNDPVANADIASGQNIASDRIKSGGADNFAKVLQEEIIPYIDSHYKTTNDRGIAGHSLGGLFAAHCLINKQGIFNRYGISSPSLFWDNSKIISEEKLFAEKHKTLIAKVFISIGSLEPEILQSSISPFIIALKTHNYKGLVLSSYRFENETHTSVVAASISRTLRELYGRKL
ncbi:alpha/beta hydrolase-fold protein [Flavobacterium sp. MFBS3-15]|uniref:alpha/beta hydrolase n=1 Tax=Flavobacterium sp. MFBS3-15 TaxID=2989816 RepID=UPI002235A8FE|nr:alpha/beta hydrolase-fold protein [Flavobacterium sp. MFBS3-15]MCW4468548.1 alpha/beta hydrolase-fold protein [Flavobacterium sp. MFBS3-15]